MRKLWILPTLLILLFSLSISAFAATDTYELPDLDIKVDISSDYTVITRDTPENSPIFSQLGMTKAALMAYFETSGIYLNAISNQYNEEIVVTMTENIISNLDMISDSEILSMVELWREDFLASGIVISRYDVYHHKQTKFFRIYLTDSTQTVHGVQYGTIYNGKAIYFNMRSYEGSLSSRQETAIKTIVDSIEFKNAPSGTVSGEDTEPFVYTDQENGMTFTVPANWKQGEFTKKPEHLDAKFDSTKFPGYTMIYSSSDLWIELSFAEKLGITRADVDNSIYTLQDVAQMFKTTLDKVSTVSYDGVEYFRGEMQQEVDVDGTKVSVTMTGLVRVENGWMYMFQFGGTSADKLYSDFESLVKSVKYPAASTEAGSTPTNNPSLEYDNYYDTINDNPGDILIIVLPLIAVVVVAVVIYRKIQEKRQEKMLEYQFPESQAPAVTEQRDFCRKCGQLLPSDSEFCHMCGTRTKKES